MIIQLQLIGTLAHWILYGVLLCQICKCLELLLICTWLEKISISRLVLYCISKRSSPSQTNCTTFTCAWNNPNSHAYTRCIPSVYAWFWRRRNSCWSWHRMVLCAVDDWFEYVQTHTIKPNCTLHWNIHSRPSHTGVLLLPDRQTHQVKICCCCYCHGAVLVVIRSIVFSHDLKYNSSFPCRSSGHQ